MSSQKERVFTILVGQEILKGSVFAFSKYFGVETIFVTILVVGVETISVTELRDYFSCFSVILPY